MEISPTSPDKKADMHHSEVLLASFQMQLVLRDCILEAYPKLRIIKSKVQEGINPEFSIRRAMSPSVQRQALCSQHT